jgi:diazepam-binding inhibitor (GABA receptor modulating acyl-CoA-binding protein)
MSDLTSKFEQSQIDVKTLTANPGNEMLLKLYSNFKQATVGDVQGKRPGMMNIAGRAKYDAWSGLKGQSKDQSMETYISFVDQLLGR